MIQTSLGVLVAAEAALTNVCALRLPAKHAYHLKKLAALVAQETKHFHTERDALIRELGTPQPDGSFAIKPDGDTIIDGQNSAMRTFIERVTELAEIPVELAWNPLTLEQLGDAAVSAADLTALGPLLADPGEATP